MWVKISLVGEELTGSRPGDLLAPLFPVGKGPGVRGGLKVEQN
jgi:hypothetical protein